jgi:hypothetical protein
MALRRYFSVRNLMRNDSRMGWREVRLVSMKETEEEKNNGYVVINMKNPRISWEKQ